jgi:hypothetical protein
MWQTEGPEGGCIQRQATETERMVMWQTGGTKDITSRNGSQEQTPAEYMRKETPEARPRTMTALPGSNRHISSAHPGIVGRSNQLASAHLRTDGNGGSLAFW